MGVGPSMTGLDFSGVADDMYKNMYGPIINRDKEDEKTYKQLCLNVDQYKNNLTKKCSNDVNCKNIACDKWEDKYNNINERDNENRTKRVKILDEIIIDHCTKYNDPNCICITPNPGDIYYTSVEDMACHNNRCAKAATFKLSTLQQYRLEIKQGLKKCTNKKVCDIVYHTFTDKQKTNLRDYQIETCTSMPDPPPPLIIPSLTPEHWVDGVLIDKNFLINYKKSIDNTTDNDKKINSTLIYNTLNKANVNNLTAEEIYSMIESIRERITKRIEIRSSKNATFKSYAVTKQMSIISKELIDVDKAVDDYIAAQNIALKSLSNTDRDKQIKKQLDDLEKRGAILLSDHTEINFILRNEKIATAIATPPPAPANTPSATPAPIDPDNDDPDNDDPDNDGPVTQPKIGGIVVDDKFLINYKTAIDKISDADKKNINTLIYNTLNRANIVDELTPDEIMSIYDSHQVTLDARREVRATNDATFKKYTITKQFAIIAKEIIDADKAVDDFIAKQNKELSKLTTAEREDKIAKMLKDLETKGATLLSDHKEKDFLSRNEKIAAAMDKVAPADKDEPAKLSGFAAIEEWIAANQLIFWALILIIGIMLLSAFI